MGTLNGKTALITGALGTIGQALVQGFAREGAKVIALDRPNMHGAQDKLDALAPGVRVELEGEKHRLRMTSAA